MCGIVGIVSLDGKPVDLAALQRMNDRQAHRGPDGEGFVIGSLQDGKYHHTFIQNTDQCEANMAAQVALGHRRLAIIDLTDRGLQPMSAGDGSRWIVFNGEIYNHLELRSELTSKGYVFRTRTDTEVLLQAYLHWGEDCLDQLEGMYAFAIWDSRRRQLFCARDRFGIKPFYYAVAAGYFIFASEIKSLLSFPDIEAVADDEAILGFLAHGNCDYGERTIVRNLRALPAAHSLRLDIRTRQNRVNRYWRLAPQPANGAGDDDHIERLRELLMETMRKHLISDVRAGSCLSGGLDSSTVVSLIGKISGEQPEAATAVGDSLHTFTSCYKYSEIDEREYALTVARSVGATPELVFPTAEDFREDFQRMAWHQDMPFGGFSFYAQWRVMRAAKEAGVKVLLDGQGGDEVFGGYAKFRYAYLVSLLKAGRVLRMLRELGATVRQGDRYVLNLRNGFRYLPHHIRRFMKVDSVLQEVLRADLSRVISDGSTPATRWWRNASGKRNGDGSWTTMQRIQIDDIQIDTLPQLLRLEDRSSMAFSIEARVPLLDHKLVEYGISLPDHLKVRNGWSKFAIRQAMRNLMPESVRLRKSKLGFAAPDRIWLSQDLRKFTSEMIGDELRCQKYIDAAALRRWYGSAKADSANTESYLGLFRILSLEMWMRVFNIP
jgi:asparagine synthase (glutamine-hydrolysing)